MGEEFYDRESKQPRITHDTMRSIIGDILGGTDKALADEVQEKINYIKDIVVDRYSTDALRRSPYWHALTRSTSKEDLTQYESDEEQQDISDILVQYFEEYIREFINPE